MFDVVVIGAGIVGLTSALRVQQLGARVVVVTAFDLMSTTSSIAAAAWFPVRIADQPEVWRWATRSFGVFARQAADGVPGVVMRPTRMLLRCPPAQAPWWAAVVMNFSSIDPEGMDECFVGGWTFVAPCVEMPLYLSWLQERFTASGGVLVVGQLGSLAEAVQFGSTVVNATGLAARGLCDDEAVRSVRGQLVVVGNPGLHESIRDEDNPAGYSYIHPRSHDVVLGGTFEEERWDTMPCLDTAQSIFAGAPTWSHSWPGHRSEHVPNSVELRRRPRDRQAAVLV